MPRPAHALLATILLVLAFTAPGTATAAQADTPNPLPDQTADISIHNESVYWIGQTLTVQTDTDGTTYDLRQSDGTVERTVASTEGIVRIDTDDLPPATYQLVAPDESIVRTFELADQHLTVTANEDVDSITIESNRANFDLNIASPGLKATIIANMIEGATVENQVAVVEVANDETTLELDGAPMPPGTYTIVFSPADTDAKDRLTLEKESEGSALEVIANPPTSQSPTTTEQSSPTSTTPTDPAVTSTLPRTYTPGTSTQTPGFGFAVGVFAILGSAYLALRRDSR